MPPEQVRVKRKCQRGLTRTRRVRGACRLGALRPRFVAGAGLVRARPGGTRPAGYGATASGHAEVTRPCPGHRAPTASVDAPISFTYHLPLCRSTTDIPYVTSSFDAIPGFPEAAGCSGSCHITVTVICLVVPPRGTTSAPMESKVTAPPSPVSETPWTRNLFSVALFSEPLASMPAPSGSAWLYSARARDRSGTRPAESR